MHSEANMKNCGRMFCVLIVAIFAGRARVCPAAAVLDEAANIVQSSGRSGGIIGVVGGDGHLAAALAKQGAFTVHCLLPDERSRNAVRGAIAAAGRYGRVSAVVSRVDRLPYAANLLTILVVADWEAAKKRGLTVAEAARAVAPLGYGCLSSPADATALAADLKSAGMVEIAFVKDPARVRFIKPYPAAIDRWTHYLHGPDGNPVAADTVVGPPRHYQWIAGPDWLKSHETVSSITTMVTSGARLFYIEDQGPTSLAGQHDLPDKWFLVARDAFNGTFLWQVPIRRWGWREWKKSWFSPRPGGIPLNIQKKLVVDGNRVFVTLGYHAPVSVIDARTGQITDTYEHTNPTLEILHHEGTLMLSVLERDEQLTVVAVDAASGDELWRTKKTYGGTEVDYYRWRAMRGRIEPSDIDPTLNIATDGEAVALIDGDSVVCLDYATGEQRWRTTFPLEKADLTAGNIKTGGNLWTGTMIVTGGVVLHASPHKLAAFSAQTGDILWERPKAYIGHLWFEWKDVFVIDRAVWTWAGELERSKLRRGKGDSRHPRTVLGYDLKTGAIRKKIDLGCMFKTHHHHRCYRNKATARYILASRRGTEYVDLAEGRHTVHNWVRGTCHMGMMPANGFQYVPPHPCSCYGDEKIKSLNALAPLRPDELPKPNSTAAAVEKGPAYGAAKDKPGDIVADTEDWPTFRGDNLRTGSVKTAVSGTPKRRWRTRVFGNISPPTAVGDAVYLADRDAFRVVCLDAADGSVRWTHMTGAGVDSPPTWYQGTVIFGSADGRVYCLDAADGTPVWTFEAAPARRLIAVEGRLESTWPVHGSVLVEDGTAYFACGRSSQLDGGITLYALDAATGAVRERNLLAGPDYRTGPDGNVVIWKEKTSPAMMPGDEHFGENYRLPMGVLTDVLATDGARLYMRSRAFGTDLKPIGGKPDMEPAGGYLDGNYFKRMPWKYMGEYARMLVRDGDTAVYIRMFDSLRGLDPSVYFTPGKKGYLLFAVKGSGGKRGKKKRLWSERVPVRVRTMVFTAGHILIAGPPDLMDLDAFEGKAGGVLLVLDAATGKIRSRHTLQSPPVFNGAAAARGRLYIVCEDGSIACFK